ncbi:MAG: hypothetical protein QM689_01825 [Oscillospiraceae bacterium]
MTSEFFKAVRYALIYGFAGMLVLPFGLEIYANIGHMGGMVLIACLAVFAGVKFGALRLRDALLGVTTFLLFAGILGAIFWLWLHPRTVDFLNAHSTYFHLSATGYGNFLLKAGTVLLFTYAIAGARIGFRGFRSRAQKNADDAGRFIDEAFSDNDNALSGAKHGEKR